MRLGARSVALAVAGVAFAIASVAGGACIVVPPPALPNQPPRPPLILRNTANPSLNPPLLDLPTGGFSVAVDPENPDDPSAPPSFLVFIDPDSSGSAPLDLPRQGQPPDDAGLSLVSFTVFPQNLNTPLEAGVCHRVQLLVARSFAGFLAQDPPGGDSVVWYYPGSAAPYGCVPSLLDGAAPPSDATDGPFTPPSDGGGLDP
jgi:hypothetical protein